MGDTIKIRLANDLWWVEVPYKKAIKWAYEVSYLTDSSCFVIITDEGGDRTSVELYRKDYNKIMDNKIFKIKFGLKKHNF
jgi:hypothetical protein|tara:strand:+ start:2244 stop:2483 length:240 start_codon:yes stop_codon:yes gene_type:complete